MIIEITEQIKKYQTAMGFKSNFLFILFCVINTNASAQNIKIEIKSDSLFFNSKKITKECKMSYFQTIVGKSYRTFDGENIVWTYDDLGFRVYFNPKDSALVSIELVFKNADDLDIQPKKLFLGDLLINNIHVTGGATISDLEKIKDIGIKFSVLNMYRASTSYLDLIFDYSKDRKELDEVAITFK